MAFKLQTGLCTLYLTLGLQYSQLFQAVCLSQHGMEQADLLCWLKREKEYG